MKFADAVRAQMRLALRSRALLFGVAVCVLPWLFMVLITELGNRVMGSRDVGPELLISSAAGMVTLALGVVWGVVVWRDEPPRTRFYHWSMPMDTAAHDLARVAAFLLWFLVILLLYLVAGVTVMAIYGVPLNLADVGATPWVATYMSGIIGFFIGAAYSTAFERPGEYVLGTIILIWGLGLIAALYQLEGLRRLLGAVIGGTGRSWSLLAAVTSGGVTGMTQYIRSGAPPQHLPVAGPLMLWLAIGLVLVSAAALYDRRAV